MITSYSSNEIKLETKDLIMTMVDCAGERSLRGSWLERFESVDAVLFVASLSSYDEMTDEKVNALKDSIKIFECICNVKWFAHTALILFLNKDDLLEKKLQTNPLSKYFQDFQGEDNFHNAKNFILKKFESQCKLDRTIYRHFTNAKDTARVATVFVALQSELLNLKLNHLGLY